MKQKHLYSKEEKKLWFGDGEWIEEPDYIEFQHVGLRCIVLRNAQRESCEKFHMFGGNLNGYVGIDEGHPFYEKDYKDADLDAHGGLTFSGKDPGGFWYFGFDCAHSGDFVPSNEKLRQEYMIDKIYPISEYRNIDYVTRECKKLAEQLNEISVLHT
jgi:hypothetical protein